MTEHMLRQLDRKEVDSYANPRLLSELRRLKVPATIFMTGLWMRRYPEQAADIAGDPLFELANHSWDHAAFTLPCYGLAGLSGAAEMAASVSRTEALLDAYAPRHPKYFRFPGGCHDRRSLAAIAGTGVTVIQWDVPGGDAFATSADAIVRQSVGASKPGSIVVLHLGGGKTSGLTDEALPGIVSGLHAKGLRPVKLSELLAAS